MRLLRDDARVSSILVFSMPDEGTSLDFARWLETRLTEPDFHQLVAELESVRDYVQPIDDEVNPPPTQTLESIIGEFLSKVLDEGLCILAEDGRKEKLQSLYQTPKALEELHFRIHADGGEYWQKKIQTASAPRSALMQSKPKTRESNGAVIDSELRSDSAQSEKSIPSDPKPIVTLASKNRSWLYPAVISSLCSAAAVFAIMTSMPKDSGDLSLQRFECQWSVAELERTKDRKDFFRKVSFLANWPDEPQKNAASLAREIAQYRSACSSLIMANFRMLSPDEQDFFRQKCKAWSVKFDAQLSKIEDAQLSKIGTVGDASLNEVHGAVGDIIKQLKKSLNDKIDSFG